MPLLSQKQIVPKHARRVQGFDEAIISLYAKGLTTGEIAAHLAEIYGTQVSRELISKVTDKVVDELTAWQNRPLDRVYPVVFIDAIHVKIRDGQVANRPIYVVLGINCDGERDVLGLWVGTGGEGAKHWMSVLTELRNRGVADVCIVACDGLKGLPDAIGEVWPLATVKAAWCTSSSDPALRVEGALECDHQGSARRLHRRPRRPPRLASPSSPTSGASDIRRSSGSGARRGSSSRSWRSAEINPEPHPGGLWI